MKESARARACVCVEDRWTNRANKRCAIRFCRLVQSKQHLLVFFGFVRVIKASLNVSA
jgi:hypothetical protein